jgi:hypothetical protein
MGPGCTGKMVISAVHEASFGGDGDVELKDYMSYEQFGVNFIRHAVTAERIRASITGLAGKDIVSGPSPAGPGGIASAKSVGRIGEVRVTPQPDDLVSFLAVLPIDLDLDIRLGPVSNVYKGLVEVPLSLTVHVTQPLTIQIEIKPVTPSDVQVDMRPANAGADLLKRVGDIDSEVRSEVARIVNEKMNTEEARASRIIDVAALIEDSWD